jgi:hypothetical protein
MKFIHTANQHFNPLARFLHYLSAEFVKSHGQWIEKYQKKNSGGRGFGA